jgi:cytosine/creatinine deaminase
MDLVIRNATLPDGRSGIDIAIEDGRIAALRPRLDVVGRQELDAGGRLVSPPFVDAHFHLDTALSLGFPRLNRTGTLIEGIALWREIEPHLTHEWLVERGLQYCDWAIAQGIQAIRSHVDTTHAALTGVTAMLEVKRAVKDYLDLQLVAFPQQGIYRAPGGLANLERALDLGVEVVGGIPHFERTAADGTRSVVTLCEIAAKRGLLLDLHCDETDDPASRHIETLAAETIRLGLKGRTAGSHLTSMHSMDNYYASKLIPLMAEAEIQAIANPLANVTLQGRHDTYPKRRGMMRVPELLQAGVNVAFGHDSVMDPFYSLGTGDMLAVAGMGVHLGHMTGIDQMNACFAAVTENAARAMHLQGYGLAPGRNGDLVVLDARDPIDAIRRSAARLYVVRRGKIVARSAPRTASLAIPGRPSVVDFVPTVKPPIPHPAVAASAAE